ncbi:MFS transporter [Chondromyces crocatus]|uniref:MFS transporter n=1 Tax=Chondromyces crocatus TaxID=52 RepID=A0A0K1EK02_CHOCO|nr:MFS transporter [Chondromyces crocatus]AKT41190.1 uncharacterized protein CMC5_053510 [Chondromyces crocatus]
MAQHTEQRNERAFTAIWLAQCISFLGFEIVGFAAGVWVYQHTRSVLLFALTVFFNVLPLALVPRLAQMRVVRRHQRLGMVLGEAGAGISTLALAALLFSGKLETWHVFVARLAIASSCAIQRESLSSAIQQRIAEPRRARANGMVDIGRVIGMIVSPPLSAVLITGFDFESVFWAGSATYLLSLVTLAGVTMGPLQSGPGVASTPQSSEGRKRARSFLVAHPGLLCLMLFFAFTNLVMGVVSVLLTPLVLGFSSILTLGFVASAAGGGVLIGSVLGGRIRGPAQRVHGVLALSVVQAVFLVVGGLMPTTPVITLVTFLFLCCVPIMVSFAQGIWKSKVPEALEKDVLAVREGIAWCALLLGYLVAGPLVDHGIEIPRLIASSGVALLLITIVGFLQPRLRRVEKEIRDTAGHDPSEASAHADETA